MSRRERGEQALFWIALVAIGVYLFVAFNPPQPPTRQLDSAALARIHYGMSEDEVVAILGMPPGDYSTPKSRFRIAYNPFCYQTMWENRRLAARKDWITDGTHLILGFDDRREVIFKVWHPVPQSSRSSWSMFVQRLREVWTWLWGLM